LLKAAIRDDDPVVFFEHKPNYRTLKEEVGDDVIPIGVARLDRSGTDLSVVTYGGGVHLARRAAEILAGEGIDIEILDLRTLAPLDHDAIARTVTHTHRLLVVHEANRTMGFGAEVAAFVADELFGDLDAPVRRVAANDSHLSYNGPEQTATIPNVDTVVNAARALGAY
jgi:pyruvate/2-oxoglutarate/acetoin dehydrogenase E1 component